MQRSRGDYCRGTITIPSLDPVSGEDWAGWLGWGAGDSAGALSGAVVDSAGAFVVSAAAFVVSFAALVVSFGALVVSLEAVEVSF